MPTMPSGFRQHSRPLWSRGCLEFYCESLSLPLLMIWVPFGVLSGMVYVRFLYLLTSRPSGSVMYADSSGSFPRLV
jgi:hypothetical protein